IANSARNRFEELKLDNIQVKVGDGQQGALDDAPFDIIVVIPPDIKDKSILFSQLAPKGQLLCLEPTDSEHLALIKYTAIAPDHYERSEHGYVNFVKNRDEIFIDMGLVTDGNLEQAK